MLPVAVRPTEPPETSPSIADALGTAGADQLHVEVGELVHALCACPRPGQDHGADPVVSRSPVEKPRDQEVCVFHGATVGRDKRPGWHRHRGCNNRCHTRTLEPQRRGRAVAMHVGPAQWVTGPRQLECLPGAGFRPTSGRANRDGSDSRSADSGGQRNGRSPMSSIGFLNASRLRGRSLSCWATQSRSLLLWTLRSVPLGKY